MSDFSAELIVKGKKEILQIYYDALAPEAGEQMARASYKLDLKKDKLVIKITATDATAFRAITNTIVGLMAVVASSIKTLGK